VFRVSDWKLAPQEGVGHAEDRGVGADAQAQSQDRDGGHRRRLRQHAQAVAKVLEQPSNVASSAGGESVEPGGDLRTKGPRRPNLAVC
jgi:hypothetical protein